MKTLFALVLLLLTPNAHAIQHSGDAYGPTREQARKAALASFGVFQGSCHH
jgi:hypothetical protein